MARFGEHGLTWLQPVNRRLALTDKGYKSMNMNAIATVHMVVLSEMANMYNCKHQNI